MIVSLPVEYQPGTWFVYNTGATYMLSAIITQLTGETLLDYLRPRLFDPLGITNPTWESDPRGLSIGGAGLHIKTEEIANFGQMYLQKGMWQGKRLLTEAWVAEATKATSDNSNTQTNPDWTVGYGYQFWRCQHNGYRGDGAFGQYCIVLPEQDSVLVMISGVQDMQAVLNKVWAYLLPAMQPNALPADLPAYSQLCDKLASLTLPLAQGKPSSPKAGQWSGKSYMLESNELTLENVAIYFGDEQSTLILHNEEGEHRLQIGYAAWLKGRSNLRGFGAEPVAACGAWTTAETYEVRICYYTSEFCPILRFHYTDNALQLEVEPNVFWGPTTVRAITGSLIGQAG